MRLFLVGMSLVFFLFIVGCAEKVVEDPLFHQTDLMERTVESVVYGPENIHYQMDVQYDSKNHEVSGDLLVEFTNNLNKQLNEVYFNLWPKAVDFTDGDIDVANVKYNDLEVDMAVEQNHMKVSGFTLEENERATISMDFVVEVPNHPHRFGWDDSTVSLGNWFPILAVYDDNDWNLFPYFEAGESFYSLTSDYEVTLTTDEEMVVATTGKQIKDGEEKEGKTTYHFEAENVRDFAIQMNPHYKIATENVDGIEMNVYYTDEQEKGGYKDYMINSGRQALEILNHKVGKYAWDELSIVGMDCEFGGMEYPQLVMICANEDYNEAYINTVVAHEIGHQWFYAAVGNNQYLEPWLDESLATFMEVLGTNKLSSINDEEFREPHNQYRLNSPVPVFTEQGGEGLDAYSEYIYDYGMKTLNDLRLELGDDLFYEAMQKYYADMKFHVATTNDFIKVVEDVANEDLTEFFESHYIEFDIGGF